MITKQEGHIFGKGKGNLNELRFNSFELTQMRIYGIK
jgi:hypothetical protein